jgi:hypothetical protein
VLEDPQLVVGGEALERGGLEDEAVVVGEVLQDAPVEDEEAAADVARPAGARARRRVGLLLLPELQDAGVVGEDELAEARRGLHAGDRGQPPVGLVEGDQGVQVDVRDPVAVGAEEEGTAEVLPGAPDAGAGHSGATGLRAGDLPVQGILEVGHDAGRRSAEGDGEVVVVEVVVEEVVPDHVALVAQAEDEAIEAVAGEVGHDVPEDGAAADLHEGLGLHVRGRTQPRAPAAAEDDRLRDRARPGDDRPPPVRRPVGGHRGQRPSKRTRAATRSACARVRFRGEGRLTPSGERR